SFLRRRPPRSALFPYTTALPILLLLPGGLALAVVSPLAGRLVDLLPAHRLLLGGTIVFVIAGYGLTHADQASPFWMIAGWILLRDRKSTRLNSSHVKISYAVFCL